MQRIFQSSFLLTRSSRQQLYTSIKPLNISRCTPWSTSRSFNTNVPKHNLNYNRSKTLQSSVPMPLNVLIVGAGVCGPAFAALLQNSNPGHNITIVERWPALRAAGQQIDLKNQGVDVLKKMGLMDIVKSRCVDEAGLEILGSDGKPMALLGITPSGERRRTLTSEYEIMRGDLVSLLYEASLKQNAALERQAKVGGLTYEFGKTITELTQSDDGVEVTFSDGQKKRYDLVVAADGQGSRTRRLAFGQEVSDAGFKSVGVHAAYYSIPRIEGEGKLARAYNAPGRRIMVTRTSDRPVTQALLFTMKDAEKLSKVYKEPIEKQMEAYAEAFKDAGWQTDRFLSEMKTCDDFYAYEACQVKMKQLHKGRVVLLGDAGYCPSPFTGMGTTGCLIGAYVLAGELARHGNDVPGALKEYERVVRPPIKECQDLPAYGLGALFPSSQLGVWILRNTLWAASKIDQIFYKPKPEGKAKSGGWKLPEYPELNLTS
ncbi:FAD/NAD(P)-binding domain-containing protein [Hypoxylon crocopeplum]|nr:FAD/NAD(P)-binding domain-containing protein [Hypoxylon crocopeplum]